jgi:hypothetical protein
MAEPTPTLPAAPANPPPFSFAPAPIVPGFDTLSLLPPAAAERLRALRQRAADAHAVTVPFEDVRTASMARIDAENALRRLQAHASEGGFGLKPDARQVIEAQRLLDRLTAEFQRVKDRSEARSAAFQTSSAALAACEDWLKHGRPGGVVLQDFDGPEPQLLKGEKDLIAAIENRRRRVRELRATKHTIESAPYLSSVCKAKMRDEIEALAARGEPDVSLLVERGANIEWPDQRVQSEVYAAERALAFAQVPDTLAIFAWLHRDAIIKQLTALIDSESDDRAALSDGDRELRLSEVESDILATERTEAALVLAAQSQQLPVEHRADINPVALLGVTLVTTPRATIGPSTSALAFDIVQPYGGRRR